MKLSVLVVFFLSVQIAFAQHEDEVALEQVIALALEQNYDIRIARTADEAARLDSDYALGAFLPQINAVASNTYNNNDQELRFQDEARNNSGKAESNNTTASVLLSWTLFDGTRMFAVRNRLAVTEEQTQLQLKQQMVNTIATVIQNYYDIVRQKQQLRAIQEQMSLNEERVKLADRRLQVGVGAKPELLQARVDYNALRAQVLQQQALIIQLKEQLNGLVDLKLPPSYDVADTILINLELQPEEFQKNIEQSNFGLRAAQRSIEATDLLIRERRAEGLPWLTFNAAYTYGRNENLQLVNPFGPLFSLTDGWNAGLTLNIPILNNFNNRRLIQQARITSTRQRFLYDQQRVNANVQVRNAFINYDNARKVLLVEEENIAFAKENVSIAFEVYRRGAATFVELRTAQQSLADAYTRLINARYLAKVAETELMRLNGSLLR